MNFYLLVLNMYPPWKELGRALERVAETGFKRWTGARKLAPKIVILITDGESKVLLLTFRLSLFLRTLPAGLFSGCGLQWVIQIREALILLKTMK